MRGEAAGQMWFDARYETGISPITNNDSIPQTFDSWWLGWMNAHLNRFEKILALMKNATAHEEIHNQLEPAVLQLDVDKTMLSIMNQNPEAKPRVSANKPWGAACGLVEDHYAQWLQDERH